MEVAKALGADHVIDVDREDPLTRIMEITGGKGVDVALDCTAGAGTIPILLGIDALKRKGGVIVAQGELKDFPSFPLEKFTVKFITMKSARGHSYRACELALAQIASKRFPLEKVTTHRFGLKDVDLAIRSVGGKGLPDVIHASLMPWE
jgi:threonine dehydrogenase-like Zn-dependent dehydrogenase